MKIATLIENHGIGNVLLEVRDAIREAGENVYTNGKDAKCDEIAEARHQLAADIGGAIAKYQVNVREANRRDTRYQKWMRDLEIGKTLHLTREDATLEILRRDDRNVAYRQGGRAGLWHSADINDLAMLMDDDGADWVGAIATE